MDDVMVLAPEWLLDDPPAPPRRGMAVITRGERVEEIRPVGDGLPEGHAIDLRGATLLPGLIDAHVHLTLCGCAAPRTVMMQETNDLLLLRAAENARAAMLAGITTLRDCGDRDGVTFTLRDAIQRGIVAGPNLFLCGQPLTTPRGHCYFMRGEVEGREQIALRISQLAARGADFIKAMATGGGLTPGTNSLALQFSADELAFIVSEARRHGLSVAAHAHSAESIQACVDAGVRTIEHATFAGHGGIEADPVTLAKMARNKTVAVPTNIPAVHAVREGRTLGLAREIGMSSERFLEGRRSALNGMIDAGIPVLAGSDAGATGVPFTSLHGEIETLASSGYTNLQAIAAATTDSAACLGLSGAGRIAPGFRADLVAVRGNLAAELPAIREIALVMCRGKVVRREAI